jgi:uncharacterized RDD family membrane protein YckC
MREPGHADGWAGPARLVTPEAVTLELATANVGSRMLAFAIDALVVGTGLVILALTGGLAAAAGSAFLPSWVVITLVTLLLSAWYFGYFIVSETLWRGRTLGKAALGLRVVTREGGQIRFRHALIRTVLGLVDFALTSGFVAIVTIMVSPSNQRLGDMVAGTLVLRERSAAGDPVPVTFVPPPGLEGYAALLDTSGLGAEEYQAVRSFLLRRTDLVPAARAALATRLAEQLATRVQPPPPPGLAPEPFLQSVAAAHQLRRGAAAGRRLQRVPSGPQALPSGPGGQPPAPGSEVSSSPAAPAVPPAETGGFTPPA